MKNLWISVKITLAMCLLLGVGYVLVLRGVSALAGPNGGQAETLTLDGRVVGAANVGQQFTGGRYFWGRPSAVDYNGGAMIAKYLLDNGYTQAIFAAECDTGADHYRWKGFQHQMRSAGIDCGEERHILLPEDLSLRRVMYGHYLDRFVQARAVALASDYDAAEVMNYLQDHGIQVPEQVSVTGFDDCIYAELMHPPLTTVRQNVPAKAEAAVELLVRLIRQEPVECKNYVQPVELIRRNSVRESTPNAAPWSQDLHKTHK